MADVKMVVVDGVRYRPEDAPKVAEVETKAATPKNKGRSVADKGKE